MSTPSGNFRHAPLDHKTKSIRVLQILPDLTDEGMVQCAITQATIEANYCCLSYVWGQPEPCENIVIDGKSFTVRENLFYFLFFARTIVELRACIWVDAICIDQDNNAERGHQVQQMGQIYSNAKCVYIWFGPLPSIPSIDELLSPPRTKILGKRGYRRRICEADIHCNPYWRRAWVTQEIALARHIKILLRSTVLDFRDFLNVVGYTTSYMRSFVEGLLRLLHFPYVEHYGSYILDKYLEIKPDLIKGGGRLTKRSSLKRTTLITLLERLWFLESTVQRDRIFSLLALCTESDDIQVDYKASHEDVAFAVLDACASTLCLCSVMTVGDTLDLTFAARYHRKTPIESFSQRSIPFIEVEVSNWKPHGRHRSFALMRNYEVSQDGLICFDMPKWSPIFPPEQSHHVQHASSCSATKTVIESLRVCAVFIPNTYLGDTNNRLAVFGREIRAPEHMRKTLKELETECRDSTNSRSPGRIRLFTHGFWFAAQRGSSNAICISLSRIWNHGIRFRTCKIVSSARRKRLPFTRLYRGRWNDDYHEEPAHGGKSLVSTSSR
jgi:hypothetical protein